MPVRAKLVVAAIVLVAAVGYLVAAGMQKGWVYFLDVDQFLTDASFHSQRVRLHGKVAADDAFSASSSALNASFNLLGKQQRIAVVYRGPLPDMFEAGRDVVVEGKLDNARVFQADVLMTKCASKYEQASPHEQDPAKASSEKGQTTSAQPGSI
jgi:cytochrome c-type biogenesis protein CcmE